MSTSSVKVAPPASMLSTPTPSRKQEHLDAGRRRLEKFREKKNAEKSKKASAREPEPTTNGVGAGDMPVEAGDQPTDFTNLAQHVFLSSGKDHGLSSQTAVDHGLSSHTAEDHVLFSQTVEVRGLSSQTASHTAEDHGLFSQTAEVRGLSPQTAKGSGLFSQTAQDQALSSQTAENRGLSSRTAEDRGLFPRTADDPGLSSQTAEDHQLFSQTAQDRGLASQTAENRGLFSQTARDRGLTSQTAENRGLSSKPAEDHGIPSQPAEDHELSSQTAEVSGLFSQRAKDHGLSSQAVEDHGPSSQVVEGHGLRSQTGKHHGVDQGLSLQTTATYATVENGYFNTRGFSSRSPSRKAEKHWQSSASMDDFSALEQHIEDLTQEKFSLQRGLAAANEVANQLAKEHSSLTENYNQQGQVVNQLREELARHQVEIKAQTLVIASLRAERAKAQHDSAMAIEQSKTLAAEVVALEERVLQVRSQGLKLERSMEFATAENQQHKKQIISLEKDRANLKSMFDAVQQEKKMLASRLLKASKSQQAPPAQKADACTSTEDMERYELPPNDSLASLSASPVLGDLAVPSTSAAVESFEDVNSRAPVTVRHNLQLPPLTSTIPDSHMENIQNINALITELTEGKAAIIRALNAESASAAELRLENMELRQKLEAQTQRLELVIAQSMAAHDGSVRLSNKTETPTAGEGDGVLGWIKWLIPTRNSVASRRRYKRL